MKRLFILFLSALPLSLPAQITNMAVSSTSRIQVEEGRAEQEESTDSTDFGMRERIFKSLTTPNWDQLPSSYISALQSYIPTPGDIYQLTISSFSTSSGNATVQMLPFQLDLNYCFDLPIVGITNVKNMDLFTLQKTITHRLKSVLPVSTVDFRLLTPALFDIFIYGKVAAPGKQRINSTFSLIDTISMAGGLTPTGSYRRVKITHENGTENYYDISKYYMEADLSVNPNMQPNDIIQILPAEILVFASNGLLYPGTYELIKGETIETVILFSGGFSGDSEYNQASVIRKRGLETDSILVQREDFGNFQLKNSDIINFIASSVQYDPIIVDGAILNNSSNLIAGQNINVMSQFNESSSEMLFSNSNNRLYIPYSKGISVLTALDMAGGPTPTAKLENAFLLKKGSLTKTPLPKLKELWQTRNADFDIILDPGDRLIIPFEEMFVYVAGEVNDPKAIPFISSFALLDYVKVAGGFTLDANFKKYYLLDLEGKRIEVPKDYTVSPGDIIYIERNFAQLSNQAFKDVLIYTSFASSLVATASSIMSLAINIRNWQRN